MIILRKPTIPIFWAKESPILNLLPICFQKLAANETLFVDDTFPNIEGAQQAGLQTVHLTAGKTVLDILI